MVFAGNRLKYCATSSNNSTDQHVRKPRSAFVADLYCAEFPSQLSATERPVMRVRTAKHAVFLLFGDHYYFGVESQLLPSLWSCLLSSKRLYWRACRPHTCTAGERVMTRMPCFVPFSMTAQDIVLLSDVTGSYTLVSASCAFNFCTYQYLYTMTTLCGARSSFMNIRCCCASISALPKVVLALTCDSQVSLFQFA